MAAEVLFTELDEFLSEVEADRDEIARRVVRVTKIGRPAYNGAVTRVYVEAAYRVADEVVRLRVFCGDLWGAPEDDKVQARERGGPPARGGAAGWGLRLRPGAFGERLA